MAIAADTGVLTWRPTAADVGIHRFTVTATDARGGHGSQTVDLAVAPNANRNPEILSMARTQGRLGDSYIYFVDASDPDGDPLTFELTTAPTGMTLDTSGFITWMPSGNQFGDNPVAIKVSDGRGGEATQSFTLVVRSEAVNKAPVVTSTPTLGATVGRPYEYDVNATDADGDSIAYSLTRAPVGMSIDPLTGEIRWKPTADGLVLQSVTVQVADTLGKVSQQEFKITVRGSNLPPVISSTPSTTASSGRDYVYAVRASDPEGGLLTYFLTQGIGNLSVDQVGVINWRPDDGELGPQLVTLRVTDNLGAATEQSFTVVVAAQANTPPDITTHPSQVASVGQLYETRDALGNETRQEYDALGRVISARDALGQVTGFQYDDAGNLVQTTFADGTTQRTTYDAASRRVSETDRLARVTRFEYDTAGRLTAVIDALDHRFTYTYDEAGRLLTETTPTGNATRYEYDGLGRRVATLLPLGQRSTTQYDAAHQVVAVTDFNGATPRHTSDARGRVTRTDFPGGTFVTFTYSATGLRLSETDARGTTQYAYDERDQLIARTEPDGTTISYRYDAAGNRTELATPAGITAYTYDDLNRIATVTDPEGGVTRYTYNAVGALTRTALPNGTVEVRSYDSLNRLTDLSTTGPSGVIIGFHYSLGANGRRDAVTEADGRRVVYTYDALDRLTRETVTNADGSAGPVFHYTYDAVGNRLTGTDLTGAAVAYIYDANDRLLTETTPAGTTTYGLDANGNTITRDGPNGKMRLTWDANNRLAFADTNGDGAADETYLYDADGNRVSQAAGDQETRFLIDTVQGYAQVVLEYRPSGLIVASYAYGNDLIEQDQLGVRSYFHTDGLGSTRALTDSTGAVTDRYSYEAFGRLLTSTGTTADVYSFAGERRDAATGLDYLRARYYDPSTGRFASRDSFEGDRTDPATRHRYLYALGNSVNRIDPSGHASTLIELAIVAASSQTLRAALPTLVFGFVSAGLTAYVMEGIIRPATIARNSALDSFGNFPQFDEAYLASYTLAQEQIALGYQLLSGGLKAVGTAQDLSVFFFGIAGLGEAYIKLANNPGNARTLASMRQGLKEFLQGVGNDLSRIRDFKSSPVQAADISAAVRFIKNYAPYHLKRALSVSRDDIEFQAALGNWLVSNQKLLLGGLFSIYSSIKDGKNELVDL